MGVDGCLVVKEGWGGQVTVGVTRKVSCLAPPFSLCFPLQALCEQLSSARPSALLSCLSQLTTD